ncbi:hypothetical protein ACLOJK_036605 [Asimina triloba]
MYKGQDERMPMLIGVPKVGFQGENMGEEVFGDFKVIGVKNLRRKARGVKNSEKA